MDTHGRKYLSQDEAGQWWYQPPGRPRIRAFTQKCERCAADFVSRRLQKYCNSKCRCAAAAGVLRVVRVPRKCLWCLKEFVPDVPSKKTQCCSKKCAHLMGDLSRGRSGSQNGNWRGGKKSHSAGYVYEWVSGRGNILQHRLVMERMLGRELKEKENVHHRNGVRSDNRPENLELWVKHQPFGQRVEDLLDFARSIIAEYGNLEEQLSFKEQQYE